MLMSHPLARTPTPCRLGRVPKSLPSLGLLRTSFASLLLGYMATAMRPRRSSRPRFLATPSSVRNLGIRPSI